mgnify:CR=1 FL=1
MSVRSASSLVSLRAYWASASPAQTNYATFSNAKGKGMGIETPPRARTSSETADRGSASRRPALPKHTSLGLGMDRCQMKPSHPRGSGGSQNPCSTASSLLPEVLSGGRAATSRLDSLWRLQALQVFPLLDHARPVVNT